MKQILICTLYFFFFISVVNANDGRNTVAASLRSATVYRSGAELEHTARATLKQGNNELVIEGVSSYLDVNSIQVNCPLTVTILGLEFSNNFLVPDMSSPFMRKLADSVNKINEETERLNISIATTAELLTVLRANKDIKGTQTGLSVAELIKLMDYYKLKSNELQNELSSLGNKKKKNDELVIKLNNQMLEEQKKNTKSGGRIILQLSSTLAGNADFNITYITQNAYWTPYYDMKVNDIKSPVDITYRAKIMQTTGIDWKQVKLSLSTSTPSQNGVAPVLKTWFLAYIDPVNVINTVLEEKSNTLQEVVVTSAYGAKRTARSVSSNAQVIGSEQLNNIRQTNVNNALAGQVAGLQLRGQSSAALDRNTTLRLRGESSLSANSQAIYVVNGTIMPDGDKINTDAIKDITVLQGPAASALYGAQGANGAIVITLKDGLEDYISVSDNELDVTYDIDLPYDVPTNGKEQIATLKEDKAEALYKYYSVPKLDKDVYLLAEISDWEKLNLLPGEANIIFEGTYIGKTFIDPSSTNDTLNLTLGKDKRVVVKRDKLKDFSSVKVLGTNKLQKITYELTVKNNKKDAISLSLKDQYPISTNKEIEVELLESAEASNNTETAVLGWKLDLAPGESKKVKIGYSVKYPKGKTLNLN